jgi:hypothetical protein
VPKKSAARTLPAVDEDPEDEGDDFPEMIADSANIAGPERRGAGRPLMFTEAEIASAMLVADGFTSVAASNLKCCHDTIDRAVKRWPALAQIQRECRLAQVDTAEGELQKAIKTGNLTAIIFFLKCQAKGRGYVERIETTGPDGGAIKSEVELTASVDFTARILGATDDQLSAVLSEALGGGESGEAPKKQKRPK